MALSMHTATVDSEIIKEAKSLPIQKSATKTVAADSEIDNKNCVVADLKINPLDQV
jgi:post-segregation antitoxin (ccd killing protein)